MSSRSDASDQVRVIVGNPAKDKKGAMHVVVGKDLQQPFGIGFDTTRVIWPLVARDAPLEGGDLEIILDIYRENVGQRLFKSDRTV